MGYAGTKVCRHRMELDFTPFARPSMPGIRHTEGEGSKG